MLKKKILAVFTILAIIISLIPVNVVKAAETLNAQMHLYMFPEGNQIYVGIVLNNPAEFASVNFDFIYDTNAVSYLSYTMGKDMETGLTSIKNNSEEGKISIAYMANPAEENHTKSGLIYGFYFDTKDEFEGGIIDFVCESRNMKKRDGTPFMENRLVGKYPIVKEKPLDSISLDKTSLTLTEGDSEALTVSYLPESTTVEKNVTWTSSNENVAKVVDGTVTAVSEGNATITATATADTTKTAKCEVIVNKKQIPLESIMLDKNEEELFVGQTDTLNVSYNPENTTDNISLSWSSSNEEVAAVENGVVTTKKAGYAVITASANGKVAKCEYNVKDIELESIALSDASLTMEKGTEDILSVIYNPENTTMDKTITWTTTDESVVTIDNNGVLKAVGNGLATITATVSGKTAICDVTVKTTLESISLSDSKITIEKNDTRNLTATINPTDATVSGSISWTSSDENIAVVSNGTVTAKNPGKASIVATIDGKSATCEINVIAPIESIALNKTETTIIKNQEEKLELIIEPIDTTDDKTIEWTSLNTRIATVVDGVVTGRKAGTVTIVATVGGKSATCDVIVKEIELEDIKLNISEAEVKKGNSLKMELEYIPENTTVEKNVTWKSSDENVAVVDENGIVTALEPGSAKITAIVGGKSASAIITVPEVHLEDAYLVYELVEVSVGDMIQLYIQGEPDFFEVTDQITLQWMSEDETIATVDELGVVTAHGVGETRISLLVNDRYESYTTIVVNEAPIDEVVAENETTTASSEVVPSTGDIAVIAIALIAAISVIGIVFVVIKNKRQK